VRRALGKPDAALDDLRWALRLEPVQPEAYLERGLILGDQRDFENAIDSFDQAIALNRNYAEAYEARAAAQSGMRNFDGAIRDLSLALSAKHPRPWAVLVSRAEIHEKMRNRLLAIADLREALSINPHFETARGELHRLGVSANPPPSASADE
jgi:tetratricopeptide (TPR) repeat protein